MKRTSRPTDIDKSPHPQTPTPDNKVTYSFKRAMLRGGKNFEQNLAIGAITDTEFLREVKEHYEEYGRAPHLNIQDSLIQPPGNILEAAKKCLILGQDALEMEETRKPRPILWPWLTGGRITEIYSARGVGKTMLGVILSVALTRESYNAEENDIGPWRVDRPCGVLYVDGEMLLYDLKDRTLRLAAPRGPERAASPLAILSSDKFAGSGASADLSGINITKAEWRDTIYSILVEHPRIKVLILDNLSALMPGVDENSKQDWDPVNQWLLTIRRLGVASIFMHHAGKGNQQRGTSAREDALDTVIKLTRPTGHKYGDMCSFNVRFEKQRHLPSGAASATRSFSLSLVQVDEEGNLAWRESETRTTDKKTLAMAGIFDGMPTQEAMERSGLSASRMSQLRKEMRDLGYMTDGGRPTTRGKDWRKGVDVDGEG